MTRHTFLVENSCLLVGHMATSNKNNGLDLQSFNDVANYIAKENDKLTQGIVNSLKTEITSIRTEFKSEVDSLASNLKRNISKLDSEHSAHAERIGRLEDTIARMQRNLELVVSGVPVITDESCKDIVSKIAAVIGFPLTLETISTFRLNKSGSGYAKKSDRNANSHHQRGNVIHPLILIKFSSHSDKTSFIGKYLTFKSLSLNDIGFQSDQRIFIKENLTPSNYKIFMRCAAAKRDNQISKFHTRDGICYIALPSSQSMIAIHSANDLNELLGHDSNPSTQPARSQRKRKRDNDTQGHQSSDTTGQLKKRRNHRNNPKNPAPDVQNN